jgi:hypothetical protein
MYLDLHAHAAKKGCFFYGNQLAALQDQIANEMVSFFFSEFLNCGF